MKFSFNVGIDEKHMIDFHFNQFWGNLSIHVDGKKVKGDFRTVSINLTKTYEFEVGQKERHEVKIEKNRKLFFAGFRKTKYKVYIDGIFTQEFEGK